jgi:hypothetical protein
MNRMRLFMALPVLVALGGCPSREFYLQQAQAPWSQRAIHRVSVPAFVSDTQAWAIADTARATIVKALDRGTVQVVEDGSGGGAAPQGTLKGAVTSYLQGSTPGVPRRVEQHSSVASIENTHFIWEMDIASQVEVGLVLRLFDNRGNLLWTKDAVGTASRTTSQRLNWPGDDPITPPAILPQLQDRSIFDDLREQALRQAITTLVDALTVHYGYKDLN